MFSIYIINYHQLTKQQPTYPSLAAVNKNLVDVSQKEWLVHIIFELLKRIAFFLTNHSQGLC